MGSPRPRSIRFLLERSLHEDHESPRIAVPLPQDTKIRDVYVRPHDLKSYDELIRDRDDEPEQPEQPGDATKENDHDHE